MHLLPGCRQGGVSHPQKEIEIINIPGNSRLNTSLQLEMKHAMVMQGSHDRTWDDRRWNHFKSGISTTFIRWLLHAGPVKNVKTSCCYRSHLGEDYRGKHDNDGVEMP